MIDAYRDAAAQMTKEIIDEVEKAGSFTDTLKRAGRTAVAAIENYVQARLTGKDSTPFLDLGYECLELLEDLHYSNESLWSFSFEEYVPTPQSDAVKQLQADYAVTQARRQERLHLMVEDQQFKEWQTGSAKKVPIFSSIIDPSRVNLQPISREALRAHSERKFAEISRKLSGK
jgi:hypothetical protein